MVFADLPAPRTVECTICTAIVGYAEEEVGSNATLAEIETFLNTTVCKILPSFLRPECAALVDEYAPVIAQKIFQGFPASVICQDIGLCSSKKVQPLVRKPQSVECTICTLIVGYAEDQLESNATLAEIETFLNSTVCGILPSFLRDECASLMNEYAPQIAQKIFQGFPASVVCQDVGLCSSGQKSGFKAILKPVVAQKPNPFLLMKLRPQTEVVKTALLMKLRPQSELVFPKLLKKLQKA